LLLYRFAFRRITAIVALAGGLGSELLFLFFLLGEFALAFFKSVIGSGQNCLSLGGGKGIRRSAQAGPAPDRRAGHLRLQARRRSAPTHLCMAKAQCEWTTRCRGRTG